MRGWESIWGLLCRATKAKLKRPSTVFGHSHVPTACSSPKPCLAPSAACCKGDASLGEELCFVL